MKNDTEPRQQLLTVAGWAGVALCGLCAADRFSSGGADSAMAAAGFAIAAAMFFGCIVVLSGRS